MSDYKKQEREGMTIIGIECRTSNESPTGSDEIVKVWQRFSQEDVASRIPNRTSQEVIALYCDYEGDFTKPFSFVLGCPVASADSVPEGMVAKEIPKASYAVFNAKGEYPQSLIETWNKIWESDLDRSYTTDFEIYGEKFAMGNPREVDVCIAIK